MKILLIIIVSSISLNAFATKARIIALSNSFHLFDEQYGYTNPFNFHPLGNMVALETGLTTSTTLRNNAEGLLSYGLENQNRIIVELGKNDDAVLAGRTLINSIVGAGTFFVPQNTVHAFYGGASGDVVFYGGGYYSNANDKVSGAKESSSGLVFSVKTGTTVMFANYSLVNSVETAAAGQKFEGAGNLKLALRHKSDDIVYGFDVLSWTAKSSTAGVENESFANRTVFARVVKTQKSENGSELFYGAQLVSIIVDCKTHLSAACSGKFTRSYLPAWIGLEANAADWLVLRGSISQPVILNNIKDDIGLPAASGIAGANGAVSEFGPGGNATTVAAGVGFKFNRVTIDGTLAGATTQNLDMANFMGQVGMIYRF